MAQTAAHPRLGGISFLHRFGSALNLHVHLHACVTDGVFVAAAAAPACDAPPAFLPARPITQVHLAAVTERVRRRVVRWFRRQGFVDAAAAAAEAPAPPADLKQARGVRAESQAQVRRHGTRQKGMSASGATAATHTTNRALTTPRAKAWAKLMARVGEEFPFACPGCGGDIRIRGDGRQEPAHFEPEARKRAKARMAILFGTAIAVRKVGQASPKLRTWERKARGSRESGVKVFTTFARAGRAA